MLLTSIHPFLSSPSSIFSVCLIAFINTCFLSLFSNLSSSSLLYSAFIRRKSLSVWLAKHPQRKCNEADNVVVCHGALLRLGWTLLLYNLVTVLVVWILLTIYTNTAIKSLLKDNTIDPTWFAFFTAVCSFNQTGFALLRDGLIPINNNTFFALLLSVVILFSNMLLPLVMRYAIFIFPSSLLSFIHSAFFFN